jgi:hypothetical protein
MDLPVVVLTSDAYSWSLQPFAYLFNQYWSALQPVIVGSDTRPDLSLPDNFRVLSTNDWKKLPADQWSDGLIRLLKAGAPELFVLLLDDYWISRTVDHQGIASLADYVAMHPEVLRLDLTTDRLYAGGMFDVEAWGHYDIIETPHGTPYQMSLQAAIWNRDPMLELLRPGKTPWQVETETSPPEGMRVLGTRQNPIRYINAFKGGDPRKVLNLEGMPSERVEEMVAAGWFEIRAEG